MRVAQCLTFALLLYVGVDFLDPSVPGVFFMDNDALFVDGVVHGKAPSRSQAPPEPHSRLPILIASPVLLVSARPLLERPPGHRQGPSASARRSLPSSAPPPVAEDH